MHRLRRTGFTLIETIIAVVVLSIAVPSMLWSIQAAHKQRIDPMRTSKARWLAQEKLEDIIADRHSTTRGYSYVITGNYPAETPVSGYAAFNRSVTVSETAADLVSAGTGYKKATVTVTWNDSKGQSRSLALATVVTDY